MRFGVDMSHCSLQHTFKLWIMQTSTYTKVKLTTLFSFQLHVINSYISCGRCPANRFKRNLERKKRLNKCYLFFLILVCTGFVIVCLSLVNWWMVFNATINNISVILLWSVLLMEETWENHRHLAHKLYHIMLYRVHLTWAGFEPTTLVVIGTLDVRNLDISIVVLINWSPGATPFHPYVEELDQVFSNGSFLIFLGKYFFPQSNHCY